MRYYPIFLDLRGRRVVVVGGGKVAERKVRKLLQARAIVEVISPALTPRLQRLRAEGKIKAARRRYRPGDLTHRLAPLLIFAATDDPVVQRTILEDAKAMGALTNLADNAAQSDFIVPASFARGDLHIAISTSGTNPALARRLRRLLAARLGKDYRTSAQAPRRFPAKAH